MRPPPGVASCDDANVTLTELLEQIRSLYVKELAGAVRSAKNKGNPLHIEPLLRDKRGEVVREGSLGSGVRLDLVVDRKGAYEDVRVDSKSRLEFDPIPIPWSKRLSVTLEPFVWDALVLEVDVPAKKAIGVARPWLDEWMDTSDERSPGKDGLARVVHFAADPEPQAKGKRSLLSLDLGSAPADALLALVDGFARAGATAVRLASGPSVMSAPRAAKKKTAAKKAPKKKAPAKRAAR